MKRKIVLFMVMGIICGSLVACGHKKSDEPFVVDEGKLKAVETVETTDVAQSEPEIIEDEELTDNEFTEEEFVTESDFSEEDDVDTVSVVLTEVGPNKVKVIKAVREATGYGLKEAKDLVDAASEEPIVIVEGVTEDEAEQIKASLEEQEATVTIE